MILLAGAHVARMSGSLHLMRGWDGFGWPWERKNMPQIIPLINESTWENIYRMYLSNRLREFDFLAALKSIVHVHGIANCICSGDQPWISFFCQQSTVCPCQAFERLSGPARSSVFLPRFFFSFLQKCHRSASKLARSSPLIRHKTPLASFVSSLAPPPSIVPRGRAGAGRHALTFSRCSCWLITLCHLKRRNRVAR